MCLEAAKSIPTGELLAYKLIARRKEDGVFVSPIQKSHVWNTNRVVVLGKAIPYANYITQQDVVSMGIINRVKKGVYTFPSEPVYIGKIETLMKIAKSRFESRGNKVEVVHAKVVDDVEEAIKTLKETGEYRILKKVVHIEWEEI